jgi:hypothetical protein
MKIFSLAVAAAGLVLAGCSGGSSSNNSSATNNVSTNAANYNTGNPITAPVDYLGAVVQAKKYAENQIDVSYINQDIQMFNASEGHYPKDLREMVPNYLAKIPIMPIGYKLIYDTNSWTVKAVRQ